MRHAFILILLIAGTLCAAEPHRWTLRDHVGHHWRNELVFFPLELDVKPGAEARYSVTDERGEHLPFQFWMAEEGPRLALLVDLPPYGSRTFTLIAAPREAPKTDLEIKTHEDHFVLSTGQVAVRIPRARAFQPGTPYDRLPAPIQAVRGASGRWLGEGKLAGDYPVRTFTTDLEARGPLFAQVRVNYAFGPRKHHRFRIRVIAGENVVLVEEEFSLSKEELDKTAFVTPPDLAPPLGQVSPLSDWLINRGMGWRDVVCAPEHYPAFTFNFFAGWSADRATKYDLRGGTVLSRRKLAADGEDWRLGLVLTPWQGRGNRVVAVGFDSTKDDSDYLGLFYRYLSRWQHPNENRVPLPWLRDGITGWFFAFEGRREWGIMAAPGGETTRDIARQHGRSEFASIRRAHVKHGETPLDKVKDWTLDWRIPAETHRPRLFYAKADLARMRRRYPNLPEWARELLRKDPIARAWLEGDQGRLARALESGAGELRHSVHAFLLGGHNTADTYTHRFQEIVRGRVPWVDIGLSAKDVDPQTRRRALALVAFLGYKLSDQDYWPSRGYGGGPSNPNMMSISTCALAMCAAACPGHPDRTQWLRLCERLVSADALMSIGPKGAWLESPGYQGAGNTPINQTVLILANEGVADLAEHPVIGRRLLAVSTYYANLLTPPDPRFDGRRMPMALGDNVPFFSDMYTYLAWSGRQTYPTAAGNAVWAWEQMGRPVRRPLLLFARHLFDADIPSVPISGKTEVFPGFGLTMRHGFGTEHETFLTFRQNRFSYGHYDDDQGSFSLFAKGAPLCLDWIDYSPGAAEHHNRVDYRPERTPWLVTEPVSALHKEADYVRAWQSSARAGGPPLTPQGAEPEWQRQMILVKDPVDPADATYLVFRDKVYTDRPSSWNCWTMAEKAGAKIDGDVARLTGRFGVDVTFFFHRKPPGELTSTFLHHRTRSYIKMDQDQIRIQAASNSGGDYGVVLYPLRRGIDKEPTVKQLADGAVEVRWPSGRRHVILLTPESRAITVGGVRFRGRAALLKYRDGQRVLVPLECEMLKAAP